MSPSIIALKSYEESENLLVKTPPSGLSVTGNIAIPGDKSISHRALMLGAIATGETIIQGLLLGEDPRSTASCFRAMGAQISQLNNRKVTVQGIGLTQLQEPIDVLNAGNSGTTLRLMLGLLAATPGKFFTVTGDASLRSRPMSRVVKPLQQMGADIWGRQNASLAPLAIRGKRLKPIYYNSPIASAQVKSCILLAGLITEGKTTVTEPALSRDHSERMLKAFGAEVEVNADTNSVTITGHTPLQGQQVIVPGDISSAAFWLVAGAIVPNSELLVENVGINPTRTGVLEILTKMGAQLQLENERVVAGEPVADIRIKTSQLQACEISGNIIPRLIDEIPILAVAAVFAKGTTIIKNAAELRVKESDRLAAMALELNKMGAKVTELPDGLEIVGGTPLTGTQVQSYHDHRITMSLAIAALNAKGNTTILGAEAASISYPTFVQTLESIVKF
jgi:3-phosphoshikimate 1-carboxyvinyltransferase